jgi:GDP-4-dehydro-6-deoxy-D-mannose reductase
MMSGPVLVTGASGFAGSHLVDLLVNTRNDVVAWHRPGGTRPPDMPGSSGALEASPPGSPHVRREAVDVLDRLAVREAIGRVRPAVVYHCAGAAHVGRAWNSTEPTFAVNVRGTHHLVEGLRAARLDARLLIPGSGLIYANADRALSEDDPLLPSSPYGLSKLAQELVGTSNPGGPSTYLARPFNHVGPRQDPFFAASGFARAIAQIEAGRWEPELAVGNLEARRDLTDVRDTVRAYTMIVGRGVPGRPYNVCSGRAIAIREVLDMLLARARAPITIRVDPARYRPNDVPLLLGNNGRIREEIGWTPEIPIERTLDDLLAFWRAKAAVDAGDHGGRPRGD